MEAFDPMQRSTNRILTTHVGSLIRPESLLEEFQRKQQGDTAAAASYEGNLSRAVVEVVSEQVKTGIDVVDDGEFGKSTSWSPFARGADRARFGEFYAELESGGDGGQWSKATKTDAVCIAPLEYIGQAELQRDIDNLKAAVAASGAKEAFMPVAAPSSAIPDRKNEYYKTEEDFLFALASALRVEYRAIVDAGFLLQIDDARAAVTYDRMVPPATFEEYYRWLGRQVDVLNYALEGIPQDRVRYHVCWGSWPGPHTTDVPLGKIADLVLQVKAGSYLIEAANPRHEHEWKVWQEVKLPQDKLLTPGVVTHSTNVVEHPELVAERILRFAKLVGRENVIAGTDCGFAQEQFNRRVHPSIQWAKLEALVAGAKLASDELWS
jgi:5-methyltetrahydropteroyltriglutamate--homocysteine methyltransferase